MYCGKRPQNATIMRTYNVTSTLQGGPEKSADKILSQLPQICERFSIFFTGTLSILRSKIKQSLKTSSHLKRFATLHSENIKSQGNAVWWAL